MAELKQSANTVQINGTLAEMNLKLETKEVTLKKKVNDADVEKKVTCKVIGKTTFSNPSFLVEVNGNPIKVEYFGVNFGVAEKALDDNGDIVDNKNFKSLETIMTKYVPKTECKNDEEPTRVIVKGKLGLNEYPSVAKNPEGEFYSYPEIVAFSISSSGVAEEDSADAEISGVIKNFTPEVKDDTETGRLIVDFISFGYNGSAEPYKFIVEADLKEDFENFYELGCSTKLNYEIITKQVGTVKTVNGGFGRREAKITSGYSTQEFSVFRGSDPFEEGDEFYVDIDTVKKALNEREIMKNQKIEDAIAKAKNKNNASTKTSSPKGASKGASNNPFGGSASAPQTKRPNPFA